VHSITKVHHPWKLASDINCHWPLIYGGAKSAGYLTLVNALCVMFGFHYEE